MNENLNLVEILKDCPLGTKLYSTVHGESEFRGIVEGDEPIATRCWSAKGVMGEFYTADGRVTPNSLGECVLFPSKTQRNWSKFKVPVEKFDPKTLKPFDKVLVRDENDYYWTCGLFSYMYNNAMFCECRWGQGIPYNDETKHLIGTNDMPDEKYIWWK